MTVCLPVRRALIWLLLVTTLAAGGCSAPEERRTITVAGSTSVQPFAEMLAEEFMARRPGVAVNVQGGGSSAGYRAAASGAAQIGMLSRSLSPGEGDVTPVTIATDAISVIVHATNPVAGLSSEQLRSVFTGAVRNWRMVGGPDRPIHVISREDGSGTRGSFDDIVLGESSVMNSAVVQDSNGAILETVAADPNAIGYVSLGLVDSRVRAIALDGVVPTPATTVSGQYRIVRPFLFVTRGEPDGVVKEFIDFVLSEHGRRILEENGLIAGS
ncbi:MAG: phosphate ABC transporter substrate-binding protein [Ignavibacteriales bacterium]